MFKTFFRLVILVVVGALIFSAVYFIRESKEKGFLHFTHVKADVRFDYPALWGRPKVDMVGESYRITFPQDKNIVSVQKLKNVFPLNGLSQVGVNVKEIPLEGAEQAYTLENVVDHTASYYLLAQKGSYQYLLQLTAEDVQEGKRDFDTLLQSFAIK